MKLNRTASPTHRRLGGLCAAATVALLAVSSHAAAPQAAKAAAVDPMIGALKKCESLKCPAVQSLIALNDKVWPRIKAGLASPDEMTRFWSLGVLTEVPTLTALDGVAAMLADPKPRIRAAAAYVLGAMKDKSVSPHLVKALADKDLNVRFSAAVALGRVKDPATEKPLIAATRDRDEEVRAYACLALGDLGLTTVVPTLMERLDQDAHPKVRGFAAMSLSKVSDKRALPLLHQRLKEETAPKALAAAIFALGELGGTKELLALKKFEASLPRHASKAVRTSPEVAEYVSDAIDKLRATTFKGVGIAIALPEGFQAAVGADGVTLTTATPGEGGSIKRDSGDAKTLAGATATSMEFGELQAWRKVDPAADSNDVSYFFKHPKGTLVLRFNVKGAYDVKLLDRAAKSIRFL